MRPSTPPFPRRLACILPLLLLGGCQFVQSATVQSAMHSAADDGDRLVRLSWVLFIGGAAILVGVMALLAVALRAKNRRWLSTRTAVVAGGVVFPVVTLTVLLAYGLAVLRDTNAAPSAGDALKIEVIGEQYWWRVRYPEDGGALAFASANEIAVPVGRPVSISITSADVIHSFWIPSFAGKMDMIPGRLNTMRFTPTREGVFRGICTEFCGPQHALMAFDVIAMRPDDFAAWRAAQAGNARTPGTPLLMLGRQVFERGGCGTCHAVRGTASVGLIGPDLTHVGSRRTIGAGSFPNNAGTLGGWVSDTQALKPEALMPSYASLSGEELRAIATYLESLK